MACSSGARGTVRPHRSEGNTIRGLMDLALPKFDGLGDHPTQARRPWMVLTDSPASPDPVCSTDLFRSPSPCLNLDVLSSDDAEESVRLCDILVSLLCGSEDGHTPVNSDQVLSDEDLPAAAGSRDRRQVIRTRDLSPDVQIMDISQVGRDWNSRRSVCVGHPKDSPEKRMQQSACVQTSAPEVRPPVPPRWSDQSICRMWDGWRPSNSLCFRGQDNCPLNLLRRSPLRIWGTRWFHCPLIASRRGDRRKFRKMEVCLMCRQFSQDF